MAGDRCWQEFQCIGCAWENPYSPRNDEHFCEVCVEDMASFKERIAAKRSQRKEKEEQNGAG